MSPLNKRLSNKKKKEKGQSERIFYFSKTNHYQEKKINYNRFTCFTKKAIDICGYPE